MKWSQQTHPGASIQGVQAYREWLDSLDSYDVSTCVLFILYFLLVLKFNLYISWIWCGLFGILMLMCDTSFHVLNWLSTIVALDPSTLWSHTILSVCLDNMVIFTQFQQPLLSRVFSEEIKRYDSTNSFGESLEGILNFGTILSCSSIVVAN